MNNLVIKGRISSDIELRATSSGKEVAIFNVAVNRQFDRETTDFFSVSAWGKTGVFVSTYFSKGQEILLSGPMQSRKWQDKEGNNRVSWELIANQVEFCGTKNQAPKEDSLESDFVEIKDDTEDLPF